MAVVDARPAVPALAPPGPRERLLREIADLERALAAGVAAGFPARRPVPPAAAVSDGPRILGPAELERVRDRLAAALAGVPVREAHARLEAMRADPGAHRGERVTLAELGQRGCSVYVVRPRLGLVGRYMGWWRVKLSSGCPLSRASGARVAKRAVRLRG